MAISQERMISLVNAALDYQRALQLVGDLVTRQAELVRRGDIRPEAALEAILTLATSEAGLLGDPIGSTKTLALEARHWHTAAKKNLYERGRQARRRQERGVEREVFNTAPKSLEHTASGPKGKGALIHLVGLAAPANAYMSGPAGPKARAEAAMTAAAPLVDLATAGQGLSPDQRAKIDQEVEETTRLREETKLTGGTTLAVEIDDEMS